MYLMSSALSKQTRTDFAQELPRVRPYGVRRYSQEQEARPLHVLHVALVNHKLVNRKNSMEPAAQKQKLHEYQLMAKRPNVHIGAHWPNVVNEYGAAVNVNVLASEAKHKVMKRSIYNTNFQNPKRVLLHMQGVEMTIRLLL
ncbi:hypothetical protein AC579_8971 [Pseudocercospora musae]|uniref:Uncharacterized protein n=1 Tax=Pseudocercospora musae TaxID=113226 RepID=A0A139HP01_9PEZI|nr:hypothetical protein AC579_8971 [Pseudocercospora musae]